MNSPNIIVLPSSKIVINLKHLIRVERYKNNTYAVYLTHVIVDSFTSRHIKINQTDYNWIVKLIVKYRYQNIIVLPSEMIINLDYLVSAFPVLFETGDGHYAVSYGYLTFEDHKKQIRISHKDYNTVVNAVERTYLSRKRK